MRCQKYELRKRSNIKILLVTEKYNPVETQRDGGARLVTTLKQAFGNNLQIMQFGKNYNDKATFCFNYPFASSNRFKRRLANAHFIVEKIKSVEKYFTHVIFIHLSMQFGLVDIPLQ